MDWASHTLTRLAEDGYRSSAPRTEIIRALAGLGCSVSAADLTS
jgi:Fe2+ or Zn2+ uptake regulation protein